jgi:hypothetical protein
MAIRSWWMNIFCPLKYTFCSILGMIYVPNKMLEVFLGYLDTVYCYCREEAILFQRLSFFVCTSLQVSEVTCFSCELVIVHQWSIHTVQRPDSMGDNSWQNAKIFARNNCTHASYFPIETFELRNFITRRHYLAQLKRASDLELWSLDTKYRKLFEIQAFS